jgi:tRNA(Ile2) C34 agmatinyltransferase TiaS
MTVDENKYCPSCRDIMDAADEGWKCPSCEYIIYVEK